MSTSRSMPAAKRSNKPTLLVMLLALSALVHLLLLALPGWRVPAPVRPAPILEVDLVSLPQEPDEPASAPVEPPAPEPVIEADTPEPPAPDEPVEPVDRRPIPIRPDTVTLQRQVLDQARESGSERDAPQADATLQFRAVPALPSAPGWLNDYVGTVTPSVDRWRGNDGSFHSRVTTRGGQVWCFSTRAPTVQEGFNPWMSVAVPMMRNCGRERPEALDRSNPWLRAPQNAD